MNAAYRGTAPESAVSAAVEVGAWAFADVDTARSRFEELPYHDGWGMTSGDIAVESLAGMINDDREYRTVFRDVNAMGGLVYLNPRGDDDENRRYGRDLALVMHRYWRE